MMNDQAKLAFHDAFVAYLIQSSSALDDTSRVLSLDPLHAARVIVLKESLDSAKVLLSQVSSHILIKLDFISGLL
jgi:hypothetical protein